MSLKQGDLQSDNTASKQDVQISSGKPSNLALEQAVGLDCINNKDSIVLEHTTKTQIFDVFNEQKHEGCNLTIKGTKASCQGKPQK